MTSRNIRATKSKNHAFTTLSTRPLRTSADGDTGCLVEYLFDTSIVLGAALYRSERTRAREWAKRSKDRVSCEIRQFTSVSYPSTVMLVFDALLLNLVRTGPDEFRTVPAFRLYLGRLVNRI